jgi:hypothetical protein
MTARSESDSLASDVQHNAAPQRLSDARYAGRAMFPGARRHDPTSESPWIDPTVLHALHDRYLLEVVEHLGLCPFARRSRELGRVHRPMWWCRDPPPDAGAIAAVLADIVARQPDAEILLPTFVVAADHPWYEAEGFAELVPALRTAYDDLGAPPFFMVAFHPRLVAPPLRRQTPESLVPRLRRTPDAVIQCVNAEVLERARKAAQHSARERMRERFAHDPMMAALIERSVQADPELSAEIARNNYDAVADGAGARELERRIAAIAEARAALGTADDGPG